MKKIELNKIVELHEQHLQGISVTELARQNNMSYYTLRRWFSSRNLKIIKGTHKSTLYKVKWKEDYFENINTKEKAYYLGLLYSDGCITKSSGQDRITLGLQTQDLYILEQFLEELNATHYKISHYDNGKLGVNKIYLNSSKMTLDLINCGIHYRKSYENMRFPEIQSDLYSDFVRGFLDGDGCVSVMKNGKVSISLYSSSLEFLTNMRAILEKKDIRCTIYKKDNSKIKESWGILYNLYIRDNKSRLLFLDYVYNNPTKCLIRKLNKAIHANTVLNSKLKKFESV